jgi:hypothetical protein
VAAAAKAVTAAHASRPVETLARAEARIARTTDRREKARLRTATKRLRHALASQATFEASLPTPEGSALKSHMPEKALRTVAPRAYRKALREASAGGHGTSRGLGEPEDLTTAITLAAPGGGFVGALGKRAAEVGGKEVAEQLGEYVGGKLESAAGKTSLKAVRAGSGVKAGGRLAGNVARRLAGKETVKAGESAARKAAEETIKRGESRAAAAVVPGLKAGKVAVIQGIPAARGHEQAIVHNPKGVAKTTARAIPGLVTVPVATAIKAGISTGRAASEAAHELHIPGARGYSGKEILAPVEHIPAEQLAFAKQVAKVVTSSDSKMVQKEVEDNLGLLLPITAALGTEAISSKLGRGKIIEGVRRIAEQARSRVGKQHGHRGTRAPRVLERTGQRKEAALAVSKGRHRLQVELQDRQRGMLKAARGATRKELVRKGVAKGALGGRLDLNIRDADVASFLQRHPTRMDDPAAMLAEVRRIGKQLKDLPKGVELDPRQLYTRDVIDHIEKHPDVLHSAAVRKVVEEYRAQGKRARETPGISPEHSERARFLPAATTRGIPYPEETFPRSVRDIVRAEPRRGHLAKDVLRRESRRDRSRSRALRRKAATVEKKAAIMRRELAVREKLNKTHLEQPLAPWQEKELRTLKELERRGEIPKGSAPVGGHLKLAGKGRRPRTTLPKLHERLRERIDRLDAAVVDLKERAAAAEEMATRKHKASSEVDPTLNEEFAARVKARLRAEGIPESQFPEYQYAGPGRVHGAPVYGSSGSKLTEFPGKSKKRSGFAEEHGMVEEGLRPLIRESIARPVARRESYKAARQVIEANRFEPGGHVEWNAHDADALFSGPDPVLSSKQWMKVPRQFYKRIYDVLEGRQKSIDKEDFELVGQLEQLRKQPVKGSHYMIVRKAAMDELVSQLAGSLVAPKIAKVNRATSFLILGTSPAWAAMQVVAEYGQAGVAQSKLLNPKFVRRALRAYKDMSPEKRQAFDSWVGVTTRSIERPEDLKLELKAGDMDAARDAYTTLDRTPYGRFLKSIPTAITHLDKWKGGRIRALATIAKIDKDLNGKANRFVYGIGGLDREMGHALEQMRGKSLKEQTEWVADHPKWAAHYQAYLDDVLGNWSALTKNERVASQVMIFYPFMRMSLRWTFYAFPKRHPIKAAMLYWLGQQNAQEVHKLLHGDPSYFTQWAMVPVDVGHGKKELLDLSRIAPGSNALVEALGGSIEGPKGTVTVRLAQPVLAALGTAVYGVNPLTGKQEPHSGWNALAQLTSLSAPSRIAGEAAIPAGRKKSKTLGQLPVIGSLSTERQDALSKLSAKLRETGTTKKYVRTFGLPPLPKSVAKERDSALLGRALKVMSHTDPDAQGELISDYANRMVDAVEEGHRGKVAGLKRERDKELARLKAEYEESNDVLDNLFERWGIPYKKENARFLKFYDEGKYPSTNSGPGARFGLPSDSGKELRERFGLPASSGTELKERFGIE